MSDSSIEQLQIMVEALRDMRIVENGLVDLQKTLEGVVFGCGENLFGPSPLMPLVPILRLDDARQRILHAIALVATEQIAVTRDKNLTRQ